MMTVVLQNTKPMNEQGQPKLEKQQPGIDYAPSIYVKALFRTLYSENLLQCKKMTGKVCIYVDGEPKHGELDTRLNDKNEPRNKIQLYHIGHDAKGSVTHAEGKFAAIDPGGLTNFNPEKDELKMCICEDGQPAEMDEQVSSILNMWTKQMEPTTSKALGEEWRSKATRAIESIFETFQPAFKVYAFTPLYSTERYAHPRWLIQNSALKDFAANNKNLNVEFANSWGNAVSPKDYTALYYDTRPNKGWALVTNINEYNQISDYKMYDEAEPPPPLELPLSRVESQIRKWNPTPN